jgi:hypothetical protein
MELEVRSYPPMTQSDLCPDLAWSQSWKRFVSQKPLPPYCHRPSLKHKLISLWSRLSRQFKF